MLFGPAGLVAGCQRRSGCEGSNRGWEEDEAGWPGGGAAGRRSVARRPTWVCVCDAWKADRAGEIDLNLQLVYPLTTSLGLIGTW